MHYPYKEFLEELKLSQKRVKEKELQDLIFCCEKAGAYPSVFFKQFINIYDSYSSKNFCEMFEQEKRLLACNQKTSEDHFEKFEKCLLEINDNEYYELRSSRR